MLTVIINTSRSAGPLSRRRECLHTGMNDCLNSGIATGKVQTLLHSAGCSSHVIVELRQSVQLGEIRMGCHAEWISGHWLRELLHADWMELVSKWFIAACIDSKNSDSGSDKTSFWKDLSTNRIKSKKKKYIFSCKYGGVRRVLGYL